MSKKTVKNLVKNPVIVEKKVKKPVVVEKKIVKKSHVVENKSVPVIVKKSKKNS